MNCGFSCIILPGERETTVGIHLISYHACTNYITKCMSCFVMQNTTHNLILSSVVAYLNSSLYTFNLSTVNVLWKVQNQNFVKFCKHTVGQRDRRIKSKLSLFNPSCSKTRLCHLLLIIKNINGVNCKPYGCKQINCFGITLRAQ